ncbi:MAG: transposase [Methanothrix sp.]|nr:transposase [Methanothrix sp.]
MPDNIHENIIKLDVDRLNFGDTETMRKLIIQLLSTIEQLAQSNQELRKENQQLKDEINRLKGEKGRPRILPNNPEYQAKTPKEKPKKWHKDSKKPKIKIDRTEYINIDKSILPDDAKHNGYRRVVRQNIKFETDNVEYWLERYYSPSLKKTYEAKLPESLQNTEFGSHLKAFIAYLYYAGRVTENRIHKILEETGIIISEGEISNILTKEKSNVFAMEKKALFETGVNHADYLNIDETGARHKGNNHYLHVVCNKLFTAFFIRQAKGSDTIKHFFGLNNEEQIDIPIISDDAGQYIDVSSHHALCWIHEIRHYKKMNPFLNHHKSILKVFLTELWTFYELLTQYKETPNKNKSMYIHERFDSIFSTVTGYKTLDERIAKTKKKKEELLLVLDYPDVPLHNNLAEIAVREGVIKRKISSGTRSELGRLAWENMLSIQDTCRKLGISFYRYLHDIFSDSYSMPRLYDLITIASKSTEY